MSAPLPLLPGRGVAKYHAAKARHLLAAIHRADAFLVTLMHKHWDTLDVDERSAIHEAISDLANAEARATRAAFAEHPVEPEDTRI